MHIADICTRVVHTVAGDATATDAALKMRDAHVGTLLVPDRTRPGLRVAGILTDRDLVTRVLASGRDPARTRVEDVMTRQVGICHACDGLFDAAQVMRRLGVRRLPVLDDADQLLGIVSSDDIHGALCRFLEAMREARLRGTAREAQAWI